MEVFGFFTCSENTRKVGMKEVITNSGNISTWVGTKSQTALGYMDLKGLAGVPGGLFG